MKFLKIIVVGGVAGNLFSAYSNPYSIGVGASAAIFAVLGALIVWVWLNFHRLGTFRYQFLAFFGVLLLLSFLQGLANKSLDFGGHFGGFFIGVCLGVQYIQISRAEDQ